MHADIENLGESAWLVSLAGRIDPAINSQVHALVAALRQADLHGVDDVLPAYASALLHHHLTSPGAIQALGQQVRTLIQALPEHADAPDGRLHHIPVCYDQAHGADLGELASACAMSPEEVVKRHSAPEYRVAMTGFAPGFPYLLGLDPRLATPRRDTPRTHVPTGSVGIAGAQTGIYPGPLPGGWQLIGCTPDRLFDPDNHEHPCLLEPGDRVRFEPIDADRFDRLQHPC